MRKPQHHVLDLRRLTEQAFVLRFNRAGLSFQPGQYLNVGLPDDGQRREYSIYSGLHDDFLEILVRAISVGHVSQRLSRLVPGDALLVDEPHGVFTLDPAALTQPHTFIATGSGIAPFHCFARSYPQLNYHILHGIRMPEERYDHTTYPPDRYTACTSQSQDGDYPGRVTDYLKSRRIDRDGTYYLCGNSDMIYEVFALLTQAGVKRDRIFTEVYF